MLVAVLAEAGVGGFLEAFADEIVRQNGEKNGGSWKDDQPPGLLDRVAA